MDTSTLYWLLKLDAIQCFFTGCTFLFLLLPILLSLIIWMCEPAYREEEYKNTFKKTRWLMFFAIPCLLVSVLLPTTKQMSIIYVVPRIVNNEKVQEIPDRLLDLTNDWLNELKPENIKKQVTEE